VINKNIDYIVKNGLCTGCGICATICPVNSISMRFNKYGEFIPVQENGCENCGLCIKVCPQLTVDKNNIKIKLNTKEARNIVGYSDKLSTWAGYVKDKEMRIHSASGGLLTILLHYLLESQEIESAIVVGPSRTYSDLLFEAKHVRKLKELNECSSSKYYPIELSKALKELKYKKEKAAVVGLPCHINSIRLLIENSAEFRKSIKYIFGLVCGHTVSSKFTEFLLNKINLSSDNIDTVSYRGKDERKEASDFTFYATKNGKTVGKILSMKGSIYGVSWNRRFFVPRACDFCMDCFADKADATFMDAWLIKYMNDPLGTSFIISRSEIITSILQELSNNKLANIWEVNINDIIKSQSEIIRYKRDLLPDRIYYAIRHGKAVPPGYLSIGKEGLYTHQIENRYFQWNEWISRSVWKLKAPAWIRIHFILLVTSPRILTRLIEYWIKISRFIKNLIRPANALKIN